MKESEVINMNKPMSMVREEFKQDLIDLVNNSGLHLFIVEPILQEILTEVRVTAKNQYELDKKRYEEYMMSESNCDIEEDVVDEIADEA